MFNQLTLIVLVAIGLIPVLSLPLVLKSKNEKDTLLSEVASKISNDGGLSEETNEILKYILDTPGGTCHAVKFNQTVRHKNCPGKTFIIENNTCFGMCFSRSEPSTDANDEENHLEIVSSCKPKQTYKKVISFNRCPDGKVWTEEIQVIRDCECIGE